MKVRVPYKSSPASYLKCGEVYTITEMDGNGFNIMTKHGRTFCLFKGCAHLHGDSWEIVKYDWSFKSFILWLFKDFPQQPAGPVEIH